MVLTKKRLIAITLVLMVSFFILLLYAPESLIGHRDDNLLLFVPKILFLALTAAIAIVFVLIFIFRSEYISAQLNTFSRFKYYLKLLIKRDFVSRYRKSILGVLWSLLNPILMMLVLTMVFSTLFRNMFTVAFFPVYLLSGQVIWAFFSESTTLAMTSVIAGEGVIKKVYVPKYMFPLSKVISSLVQMAFSLAAFFIVVIVTGAPFYWTMLLIPIPVLYIFVFSLGVAMLISSLSVFFRDLTYLYGVFTTLLMYLSAIFWPVEILEGSALQNLIGLNPLYQFIRYFRYIVYWGKVPDLWFNFVCIGFALSALCIGTYVFMRQQDKYILSL
ncbi:MAG: ABC transporter permease [Oscillospiraceae bacterium]|nr:ABC transporter permease [Oscillospiraceae bacterium]